MAFGSSHDSREVEMQKSHRRSLFWSLLAASAASTGCSSDKTEDEASAYVAPEAAGDPSSGAGLTMAADGTGGSDLSTGSDNGTDSEASGEGIPIVGGVGSAGASASDASSSSNGAGGAGEMVNAGGAGEMVSAGGAGEMVSAGGAGGAAPEDDRIVLFDGTDFDAWVSVRDGGPIGWQLVGDGTMVVTPGAGDIITRQEFEDVFVHLEYKTPAFPPEVTGQARGNSGVYLKGSYEAQVLDSFGLPPQIDGCGAIYMVSPPLSVACNPQEVWNTYEIDFQAPRFDAQGNKTANARMLSVTLNGVLVQNDVEVPRETASGLPETPGPAGIMLQDHGNLVAFRNIYVIPR
jgi:Domain of Unknown Function (DUF1080)